MRYLIAGLLLLFSVVSYSQTPVKGAGICYVDTVPYTAPVVAYGCEIMCDTNTSYYYRWDRQDSTWEVFAADTLPGLILSEPLNMTDTTLVNVGGIQFDLTPTNGHAEGFLHWSDTDGTLEVGMPGGNVEAQLGQEVLFRAKSEDVDTIFNGDVIYVSDATGAVPLITGVDTLDYNVASRIFGMATEDILPNQKGYVTFFGLVRDINTSGVVEGLPVYLDSLGDYTNTPVNGTNAKTFVGITLRSHATQGVMGVNPRTSPRIRDLSWVSGTPDSTNTVLIWNDSLQYWQPGSISAASIYTQSGTIPANTVATVTDSFKIERDQNVLGVDNNVQMYFSGNFLSPEVGFRYNSTLNPLYSYFRLHGVLGETFLNSSLYTSDGSIGTITATGLNSVFKNETSGGAYGQLEVHNANGLTLSSVNGGNSSTFNVTPTLIGGTNSSGTFTINNYSWDTDQSLGAAQHGYVMTYDTLTSMFSAKVSAGGGGSDLDWLDATGSAPSDSMANIHTYGAVEIRNPASEAAIFRIDTNTIAIGNGYGLGQDSSNILIGGDSIGTGTNNILIGTGSSIEGTGYKNVIIGGNITTVTNAEYGLTLLGYGATHSITGGIKGTVIGSLANVRSNGGTAIGYESDAGDNAVSIGHLGQSLNQYGTGVGGSSKANATGASSYGYNSVTTGTNSTSIGRRSRNEGIYSNSFGYYAENYNDYSNSIGTYTESNHDFATVIGTGISAANPLQTIQDTSITLGLFQNNILNVTHSDSFGGYSRVGVNVDFPEHDFHVATRAGTDIFRVDSVDFLYGNDATESGLNTITIGEGAETTSNDAVAIGSSSESSLNAVAVGNLSQATQAGSVAIGKSARSFQTQSTVIGDQTYSNGIQSNVFGKNGSASQSYSNIFGSYSSSNSQYNVIMGYDSDISSASAYSVILGNYVNISSHDMAMAIGIGGGAASKFNSVQDTSITLGLMSTNIFNITHTEAGGGSSKVGINTTPTFDIDFVKNNGDELIQVGSDFVGIGNGYGLGQDSSNILIGGDSIGTGTNNIAIGLGVSVLGAGADNIFIGSGISESGTQKNILIGRNVNAATNSDNSVLIGNTAVGTSNDNVGIGSATSVGLRGVSVGYGVDNNYESSTGVGYLVDINSKNVTAVGATTNITGIGSTGIGRAININGEYSVGLGYQVDLNSNNSMGLGNWTEVNHLNAIVIGMGVNSTYPLQSIADTSMTFGFFTNNILNITHTEASGGESNVQLPLATEDTSAVRNVVMTSTGNLKWITRAGGTMYVDSNTTAQSFTNNTWQRVDAFDSSVFLHGMTFDADSSYLVVDSAGVYEVSVTMGFSGTVSSQWQLAVFVNGVRQPQAVTERKIGTGGDVGSAAITPVDVYCPAGGNIALYAAPSTGNDSLTLKYGNLHIKKE